MLRFPSTSHSMNWRAYGLNWLSAQGRTYTVYR